MTSTIPLKIAILIPARYHSTRLPGKPLALISGKTMLERVWRIAKLAQQQASQTQPIDWYCAVVTEDQRIQQYCSDTAINCLLTSAECQSGTERILEASQTLGQAFDLVVNLQGDNVLCPPWFITKLVERFLADTSMRILTPAVQLSWSALDALRLAKSTTPFSGTTVVVDAHSRANWFSKLILPAMRDEANLRVESTYSPVLRHIGLYAYHGAILSQLQTISMSPYEAYEGLEQLRYLQAGIPIEIVAVDYRGRTGMNGVDSLPDVQRAEAILEQEGEFAIEPEKVQT